MRHRECARVCGRASSTVGVPRTGDPSSSWLIRHRALHGTQQAVWNGLECCPFTSARNYSVQSCRAAVLTIQIAQDIAQNRPEPPKTRPNLVQANNPFDFSKKYFVYCNGFWLNG
eukprot:682027-Amphidinium_carterae.2